jgi:predicted membrane protein
MENNRSTFFSPQFLLGIMIIGIGVVFMLDNLEIIYAGNILRFWPAILVVFGASKIAQSRNMSGQIFGWIIAAAGTLMLLDVVDLIDFRIWDWWPIVLIIIGLNFLRSSRNRNRIPADNGGRDVTADSDAYIKNMAMMSGVKRIITSKDFRGGELSALMGGCEIDLRDAEMRGNEAVIDVNIIMGGIELRVPMGWTVSVEATPIMGGVEDKTYPPKEGTSRKLVLTGTIIMGGVEIKN